MKVKSKLKEITMTLNNETRCRPQKGCNNRWKENTRAEFSAGNEFSVRTSGKKIGESTCNYIVFSAAWRELSEIIKKRKASKKGNSRYREIASSASF